MLRRIAIIAVIAGSYAGAMYTTFGCRGASMPKSAPLPWGWVRGTLTDAHSGAAVAFATINGRSGNTEQTGTSNDAGFYEISVQPGEVTITVTKPGYVTFTRSLPVDAKQVVTLDIQLQPRSD